MEALESASPEVRPVIGQRGGVLRERVTPEVNCGHAMNPRVAASLRSRFSQKTTFDTTARMRVAAERVPHQRARRSWLVTPPLAARSRSTAGPPGGSDGTTALRRGVVHPLTGTAQPEPRADDAPDRPPRQAIGRRLRRTLGGSTTDAHTSGKSHQTWRRSGWSRQGLQAVRLPRHQEAAQATLPPPPESLSETLWLILVWSQTGAPTEHQASTSWKLAPHTGTRSRPLPAFPLVTALIVKCARRDSNP